MRRAGRIPRAARAVRDERRGHRRTVARRRAAALRHDRGGSAVGSAQAGTAGEARQESPTCRERIAKEATSAADHLAPSAERLLALRAVDSERDGTTHRPEKTKGLPSASPCLIGCGGRI